jgi:hypothetical protein
MSKILCGIELQIRRRATILKTKSGQSLSFDFELGPLKIFIIVGLPGQVINGIEITKPIAYIKATLAPFEGWEVYKEHISEHTKDDVGE